MDTILSIDLDILMSPYCGIYNHFIDTEKDDEFLWDFIGKIHQITEFNINEDYEKIIINILNNYIQKVDKVYIGYDHSSILSAIQEERNSLNQNYLFNIYNIDYHHDIFYNDIQKKNIIDSKYADCGSWVGFLNYYNCVNSYHWVKGIGAEFDTNQIYDDNFCPKNLFIHTLDNNFPLDIPNIKILYITKSNPWFPQHCLIKINDIIENNIPQNKIKYLEGPYSINHNKLSFLNKI